MRRFCFIFLILALILSMPLLAQGTDETRKIDEAIVLAIMGVWGVGVAGITQMIKKLLKASGIAGYIISAVVGTGATIYTLGQMHILDPLNAVVYSVIVFLEANGLYKIIKKP